MLKVLAVIVIIVCVCMMGLSFGFCRICDKWHTKCRCHKINPEQDVKDAEAQRRKA